MTIKQEELPTAESFLKERGAIKGENEYFEDVQSYYLDQYLKLHKDRIKYEYDQYQFFLEGYKNGSASISEVTNAHNEFLKLLE